MLEERDAARADSRLKARFLSYRLNQPSADESAVLLTTDDWGQLADRAVPEPKAGPNAAGRNQGGCVRLEPRITRWSESAFDIRALRRMVRDAHRDTGTIYLRLSLNANLHLSGTHAEPLHVMHLVSPVLNTYEHTSRPVGVSALLLFRRREVPIPDPLAELHRH